MTFAAPWMLLGCLAAFIPLLVHLFDRRRPRQVPFGAIAFVLKSQRRTASRLRLKRLLLYALRTLIFLAIPIALARPQSLRDAVPLARGVAATAVILDTSLAMRWRDGRSLLELGREEARAALRELTSEEPALVLPCSRTPAALMPLGFERSRLFAALDEVKAGYEVVDLQRCLETALRALDDSPLPGRRLVVVSAFTESSWRLDAPLPLGQTPKGEPVRPEVVLRDVAQGRASLPNHALVDLRAESAPQLGPRHWRFTFTVRNFSAEAARDVEVQLRVGAEVVAKGFVDLSPGGTAQKAITHRFAEGGALVVTGALPPDALAEDDERSLVLNVPKDLRALVVDGEPSPQKYRDEAFFVDAALSAPGSPARSVVRDADAAWREDFAAYDALFLLNVEGPPAEVGQRLRAFVERGGGLFYSVGPRTEVDAANAALRDVLPRSLRVIKTAVEPGSPETAQRAARLQVVSASHPLLAPFTGQAREGLLSARFNRYVLFDSAGEAQVLATLDDGAPAVVAGTRGQGRVLAFASSVDRDWTDFPIRTAFLPFIQRAAAWLTGTLEEREDVRAKVGDVLALPQSAAGEARLAIAPSGVELPVTRPDGQAQPAVGPLPEPGPYQVVDAKGTALPLYGFAAVLDPAASDLTRHAPEALARTFGEDVVKTAGFSGRDEVPLWTWFLVAAVLAFFLEGLLLRKP